jgi:hypothetical protein
VKAVLARVAHTSRVLVSASRRNNLLGISIGEIEKSVIAGRDHQHARRVRYPDAEIAYSCYDILSNCLV